MIEINNLTRSRVDEALLRRLAQAVLKGEKRGEVNLSVALVGAKRAAELNKKYRKKDKAANVLSFPTGNGRIPSGIEGYLGEVVLCPSQVRKDAKKYGMMFEQALAWMFVHGILHLLGYDHKKEKEAKQMEQKEHFYLSGI